MKTKYLAVALASLMSAACFTSCSNDELIPEETQTIAKTTCPKVIHVNVEGGTRAYMGEGNKPMWEVYAIGADEYYHGDLISITSLNASNEKTAALYKCTDAANGEFTLFEESGGWSNGEGVGPYIVSTTGYADITSKTISVTQVRTLNTTPLNLSSAYMACYTEDISNCTLKNIMALLKVTVPDKSTVNYLKIEHDGADEATYSFGSESGSWGSYVYKDDTDIPSLSIGEYAYPIYGSTADDIQPLAPGDYFFPVIPQTFGEKKSFSFKLSYTGNKWNLREHQQQIPTGDFFIDKEKKETITLEAGKIYDLGTVGVDF